MSKSINMTVRMSLEESQAFGKFAKKHHISKSELLLRCARYCCTGTAEQDNPFIAPYLPPNYIANQFANIATDLAKQRGLVVLDGGANQNESA